MSGEEVVAPGLSDVVVGPERDRECPFEIGDERGRVRSCRCDERSGKRETCEHGGPHLFAQSACRVQADVAEQDSLVASTGVDPQWRESPGYRDRPFGPADGAEQCGTKVRVVRLDQGDGGIGWFACEIVSSEPGVEVGDERLDHVVEFSGSGAAAFGELPDHFAYTVRGVWLAVVEVDERLVDQRGEQRDRVLHRELGLRRDEVDGDIAVEGTDEHAQATQCRGLAVIEQPVRPRDRRIDGLLAEAASAYARRRQVLVEVASHVGDGHDTRPRRNKLDRERDPVELTADIGDRASVVVGHREA